MIGSTGQGHLRLLEETNIKLFGRDSLFARDVRDSPAEGEHRFLNTVHTRKQLTKFESQQTQQVEGFSFLRPSANTELLNRTKNRHNVIKSIKERL